MPAKTVLITGSASGLGLSFALEARSRGYNVIATDLMPESNAALRNAGCDYLQLDITKPYAELADFAEKAWSIHNRVDYLFNNAGIMVLGALEEMGPDRIDKLLNVQLLGHIYVTKAFIPHFRKQKSGSIVFTSSIGATQLSPGNAIYCMAKAAISGLTESLAKELAPFNVRCMAIELGSFETGMCKPNALITSNQQIEGYTAVREFEQFLIDFGNRLVEGDTALAAANIFNILESEKNLPYRLPLGDDAVDMIPRKLNENLEQYKQYRKYGQGTTRPGGKLMYA